MRDQHFQTQTDQLYHKWACLVDTVYKLENIEQSREDLKKTYKLWNLEKINMSSSTLINLEQKTKNSITSLYHKDFETFAYSIDNDIAG